MRAWAAIPFALALLSLSACSTSAVVTRCPGCDWTPRDQAAVIEVVQDTAGQPYTVLGHIRAGGNVEGFDAIERVKVEARKMGADAIVNVHRVTGTDEAIYEADAIAWAR